MLLLRSGHFRVATVGKQETHLRVAMVWEAGGLGISEYPRWLSGILPSEFGSMLSLLLPMF